MKEKPRSSPAFEKTRLLGGRVTCFQPVSGYRSAIDAVLLQAAVDGAPGERVLDLGCGVGAASLCLAARLPAVRVDGLDFQAVLIEQARRGAAAGGMTDRVCFHVGDLLQPPPALVEVVADGGFDHVMANPPYQPAGTSRPSPDPIKAAATVEGSARLADWVAAAAGFVRVGGTVTVIHRGDRLDELATAMAGVLGGLAILPFLARADAAEPRRVVVQGRRGAAPGCRRLAGLVLHENGGKYSARAENVLRDGGALPLGG